MTVVLAVPFAFTVKFFMSPACGPSWIFQPVMFHVGIEMTARRGERRFALADCMDVDGMLTRRQVLQDPA